VWFMTPEVVKEFLLGSRVAGNIVGVCLPEMICVFTTQAANQVSWPIRDNRGYGIGMSGHVE
jgi:hypothetical protein